MEFDRLQAGQPEIAAAEIEAAAKRRLADEYDAAQERGDAVGPHHGYKKMKRVTNSDALATAADYGLTRQEIHRARQIRDAEKRDPGVVRRTVDAAVKADKVSAKNLARRSACGGAVSFSHRLNARRLLRRRH